MLLSITKYFCRNRHWAEVKEIAKRKYDYDIVYYDDRKLSEGPIMNADFIICVWPKVRELDCVCTETGFFRNAGHMDVEGLFDNCSFAWCHDACWKRIEYAMAEFNVPKPAQEVVGESKFPQIGTHLSWQGVVLAAQLPWDRSVTVQGGQQDYWRFIKEAAEYYGKDLFVKLHPQLDRFNLHHIAELHKQIAEPHGAMVDYAPISVINDCRFVISYNSTFCVDALLRGVPVAQYRDGYFSGMHVVSRCGGVIDKHSEPGQWQGFSEQAQTLVDFLVWRYCYNYHMPAEKLADLIHAFVVDKALFPLPVDLSYGANAHCDEPDEPEMSYENYRVLPGKTYTHDGVTYTEYQMFEANAGLHDLAITRERLLYPISEEVMG